MIKIIAILLAQSTRLKVHENTCGYVVNISPVFFENTPSAAVSTSSTSNPTNVE